MPTEIINGVECIFPKSSTETFDLITMMIRQALYARVEKGEITLEQIEELEREANE